MSDLKEPIKGADVSSVYSMDSAYQSQSGTSRRRETHQTFPIQDQPSQMADLMTQGISPSLTSESYTPLLESHDISQAHTNANLEFGNGSQWYANHSTAQNSIYSPMARPMQHNAVTTGFTWNTSDMPSYGYGPSLNPYSFANETEFFRAQLSPQRQIAQPRVETPTRPAAFLAVERTFSHASTHSSAGRASVGSSATVQPLQPQSFAEASFDSQALVGLEFSEGVAQTNSPSEELPLEDAEDLLRLEEEHHKVARSHSLYSQEPGADGLYHCPYEGEIGCNHKPTTLKCNYDKYVDSHLKPFRCKVAKCESIPFSSTACLLRHEREAHGMHGHGSRPNLCHYPDCERSVIGHGFPRRYNLFDHMRRVHGWQSDKDETSASTDGHVPGSRKGRVQKRKASTGSPSDKKAEKKARISKAAQQQQQRERQRTRLNQEWISKKQSIATLLTGLNNLGDLGETENAQLMKDFNELFALREKYHADITEEGLGG